MPHFPRPIRLRRLASFALASLLCFGVTGAAGLSGCGKKTQGIRNADEPTAVEGALNGVWTVTLNPEAVDAGVDPLLVSMQFEADRPTAGGGRLAGSIAESKFSAGRYTTGGETEAPGIEFTSGEVMIPAAGAEGERPVQGPLTWKATLQDDESLAGTVTGGGGDAPSRWTAKKNSQGL